MPAVPLTPCLEVSGLSVELDGRSLFSDASFNLHAADIAGLYGDSGCGKTTLALALMRLLPADRYRVRGSIRLAGVDILPLPEREFEPMRGGRISMIFQDPLLSLNPVMRVRTQVEEVRRAHRENRSPEKLFEMVGLPTDTRTLDAYPHQLSGGERQRVAIAQALAGGPQIVIADEPFTALDTIRVVELAALFRRLSVETGIAFLLITHSVRLLAALAKPVLRMDGGVLRDA